MMFPILSRQNTTLSARASETDSLHALQPPLDPMGLQAKVVARKWVSIVAMCFNRMSRGWRGTAQRVLAGCDGFYMSGINASASAAQMVGLKFFRHDLNKHAIDDLMGVELRAVKVHAPIAAVIQVSGPQPTRDAIEKYRTVNGNAAENRAQHLAADNVTAILNFRSRPTALPVSHGYRSATVTLSACKGIAAFAADCRRIFTNHLSLQLGSSGLGAAA